MDPRHVQTCPIYIFFGGKPKLSAKASVFQPSVPLVTPYAPLLNVSLPPPTSCILFCHYLLLPFNPSQLCAHVGLT